jgi:Cu/Ag efflux pump CusA
MTRTSSRRWLIFALLLVPCLALAATAAFFSYLLWTRLPWAAGTTSEPVLIEVVASFPGASPEEVERQVTIPLEVSFAGMPRLQTVHSQSSFGRATLRLRFDGSADSSAARQEVINRLAVVGQPLPPGVTPLLHAGLPDHEVYRYTLAGPVTADGRSVYTLNDLRALQDWVVERELRRVPRVVDVEGRGGTLKHYEIHPDADRLRRFGLTLKGLTDAIAAANRNVGGEFLGQGALNVRGVGVLGGGEDPVATVVAMKDLDPATAGARLRQEENRRLREIRNLVIAHVNNTAVLVEDVIEGGRQAAGERTGEHGVVVGGRPQGTAFLSRPHDADADWWDEARVEGVVFLRRGEDAQAALRDIRAKVDDLNSGGLLPGVRIEPLVGVGERPEDRFWIRADFPADTRPERLAEVLGHARTVLRRPEVAAVLSETDGPDATAARPGSVSLLVRLKPDGAGSGGQQQSRDDLVGLLRQELPGIVWSHSTAAPDAFALAFEAAPGEGLVKVFGRNPADVQDALPRLEEALRQQRGVEDVRRADGGLATRLEFRVDRDKCRRWGVTADDANTILEAAVNGKTVSTMIEGDKLYDITVAWPERLRADEAVILDIPVDTVNNQPVPAGPGPETKDPPVAAPRLRLRDLVSPVSGDGDVDPPGDFRRRGVSVVCREDGRRLVAIRFRLREVSLDRVRDAVAPVVPPSCRAEWVGR